ncbi:MAG: hypothetical protein JO112_17985 [Planctomycetes bacterium]|nr:hypothetical protein [Planctomycetota bacterium]
MGLGPLEKPVAIFQDPSEQAALSHWTSRLALGGVGLLFGVLAAWLFWMVQHYLTGHGWFDLIVSLVLYELSGAAGLLALVLLIRAVFAPAWLSRILAGAIQKLGCAIALFCLAFIGAHVLFFFFGGPFLVWLGILPKGMGGK